MRVTESQALGLRDIGYNVPLQWVYTERNRLIYLNHEEGNFDGGKNISAPDIDSAIRWLREVKGVHVYADKKDYSTTWHNVVVALGDKRFVSERIYPSHDLAQSAGLDAAIEYVKKEQI